MKHITIFSLLSLGLFFLQGCVSLVPEDTEPTKKVTLTPHLGQKHEGQSTLSSLVIEKPLVLESLDTRRLKIIYHEGNALPLSDVIAGVEWSDKLSTLIQNALVRMFEETRKVKAVGTPEENFRSLYCLQLKVTNFEIIKALNQELKAQISYSAKLLKSSGRQVLAQHQFTYEAKIEEENLQLFIHAFNEALSGSLSELITWTLKESRKVSSND